MTLHKRGGAQSCLDYRHGVSSYCAGLNALAGSRVACAWMAARRLLLPHCYATITMPYWNENECQIRRPGKPDEKQEVVCLALIIDVASLPVTRKRLEPPGESLT